MPSEKKKSGSGGGSQKKPAPAPVPKLHASAKEFVPSSALKASSSAWKPTDNASKKSQADSGKGATAKNGAKPSAAEAVKQAPKAAPAPSAWGSKPSTAPSAWGSKSSAAVKNAGPARPQQVQQQKSAGQRQNQQQQQHQGRGGRDNGRRGGERSGSGRRNDQGGGGGGGNGGGSWARSASKPGSGGGNDGGGHRDRGGRQSQSRGGGGGDRDGGDNNSNWSRGKAVPKDLMGPGDGETDAEKSVKRITVEDLLSMRMDYLAPPSSWEEEGCATKPPPACFWDSPTRIDDIKLSFEAPRIGGDVSQKEKAKRGKGGKPNPNDTAPALEDCKPLEVNNETRWKARVMEGKDDGKGDEAEEVESKDEILRKAMLILNKLSLTKFDKLSDEFIACGIGRDIECLTGAVSLIVNYAHEQQHFSSMWAGLCIKLANTPMEGIDLGSKKGKKFKKILLERCQTEFETDTETKIKEATKDIIDKEEIEYHAAIIKKHYLGHMRFIGELYKGDLLSIKIMLHCLPALLKGDNKEEPSDDVDEEKVECFSKLMTVIGSSLEQQSGAMKSIGKADAANSLADCWRTVEIMAGKRKERGPKVSNRMKFMLQDLLEMKSKGWVTRRKEETAKTIAQIHKEVASEERAAKRSSSSASLHGKSKGQMRRGASSGDVRVLDKAQTKPQVDKDGFVSVATTKGFNRSASMGVMHKSQSKEGFQKYSTRGSVVLKSESGGGRRTSQGKFAVLNESDSRRNSKKGSSNKLVEKAEPPETVDEKEPVEEKKPEINYPSANECGDKAKNVLKEYIVGGDADDAILSIHELVGVGNEGSIDRGTKVVESAVLMVLEMKQSDVDKFLGLYLRCAKEEKIEGTSFVMGLNDPLEFLNDVAIDAPLAIPILANIIAELVKADVIPFNFLLDSPDYFRTDQNAAEFGAKIMKNIGGDAIASEDYIEVIEKLMTDDDKAKHSSAQDLIAEV
eukprot:CAMPEP_0181087994 /NCGR_PEP_ID=MMETSP1071-20121207/6556_1 /TAXON_ID=35127 /ORGANISM="Thalassiosira sp., Strain NH16" /LENGTH=964 /DNA_ID=CAMNT_0023169893 /DNA_START=444 /DNA_END=3338 /DNA_ORIENTATION=+